MTTKKQLHIFIIFFFIISLVLPKTENILLAKNVAAIEMTIDDNINKQDKQDKQNVSEKDDKKTDIWAIVTAIITIVSLIFLPFILVIPQVWFLLTPLALMTAIYSLRRIKRQGNLKGKFWDYLAIVNSGILLLVLFFLIIASFIMR